MAARVRVKIYPSSTVVGVIRNDVTRYMVPKVNRTATLARAFAPVDTGALRASIRVRARSASGQFASAGTPIASWEVVAGGGRVGYAHYMEAGTRPHVIESHGPWPLRNRKTGQVFGRRVMHPGTRPYRFMARAMSLGLR